MAIKFHLKRGITQLSVEKISYFLSQKDSEINQYNSRILLLLLPEKLRLNFCFALSLELQLYYVLQKVFSFCV